MRRYYFKSILLIRNPKVVVPVSRPPWSIQVYLVCTDTKFARICSAAMQQCCHSHMPLKKAEELTDISFVNVFSLYDKTLLMECSMKYRSIVFLSNFTLIAA